VAALLRQDGVRLVTLTGPGGVGKTRLALRVAETMGDTFPDGAVVVPLADVTGSDDVLPAIAHACGLWGDAGPEVTATLARVLGHKCLLLVLDNLEQVRGAAPALAALLAACPWLQVLATSRARLRVSGEHVVTVPPLALPSPRVKRLRNHAEVDASMCAEIARSEAVQLFVSRAQAVHSQFALRADNAAAVAVLCRQLDGLPLAIELAATRVDVLPPEALVSRLNSRLPLLTGGPCDAPVRHHSLRDTIAWSYDLLRPTEQALFRRLSVVIGDWPLDAAEALAQGDGDLEALNALSALVDANLIQVEERGNAPRYRMLETIREFAAERLADTADEPRAREAYARYMLHLASRTWWAFPERHSVDDARGWLEHTLALADHTSNEARALALACAALSAFNQRDFDTAEHLAEASLELSRPGAFDHQIGLALYVLLLVSQERGDFSRSAAFGEEAIEHFRRSRDDRWLSEALMITWFSALLSGDSERASELGAEGFALCRATGNLTGLALGLNDLGVDAELRGDGSVAFSHYRESLALLREFGDTVYVAHPLASIASILGAAGQCEFAAQLLGVVARIHETHRTFPWIMEQERDVRTAALARATLGEERYVKAFEAGGKVPIGEAVQTTAAAIEHGIERIMAPEMTGTEPHEAVSAGTTPGSVQSPPTHVDTQIARKLVPSLIDLTRREREVLQLLTERRSDREIAHRLYIGVRTVEFHVGNILAKLDAINRHDAVAIAARFGLL
jgi:predicted ATPase/DNA-binding CsgD family transcriptional regulator